MSSKNKKRKLIIYLLLAFASSMMIFPFLWMLATSFKTADDVYSLSLIPKNFTLGNYSRVFESSDIKVWFMNSFIVASINTSSVLFFDSLVGYTLAKIPFRGKKGIFIGILSTLMIPTEMLIIPWFLMINRFGWTDSYWSLLFPTMSSAFGIFMMRQFFKGVPDELLESARIDGIGEFGLFWKIGLPLVKPALSALAIFTFLQSWNSFLWPVIAINSDAYYTLPVGLATFSNEILTEWEIIMTGASLATVPVIIVFIILQKQIIEGIQLTGVKG